MLENENVATSSDDEISAEALREACDDNFLPQSLFSNETTQLSENEEKNKREIKPSLRITERADNFESFGVSQNFKDFVAKKLDAMLDRKIKIRDNKEQDFPAKKKKKRNNFQAGIKLLSSSNEIIVSFDETKVTKQAKKEETFTKEFEAKNFAKCQEVAVTPISILSKNDTKSWNERQRGNVFKYKKTDDGTLIEQQ